MSSMLKVVMAMAFLFGTATASMAMDKGDMKNSGEANTPDKIQRSAPSGEKPLPGGSGPGSRTDELVGMEDVDPKDPKLANKKGSAAQAARDLQKKNQGKGISSQSSTQQKH